MTHKDEIAADIAKQGYHICGDGTVYTTPVPSSSADRCLRAVAFLDHFVPALTALAADTEKLNEFEDMMALFKDIPREQRIELHADLIALRTMLDIATKSNIYSFVQTRADKLLVLEMLSQTARNLSRSGPIDPEDIPPEPEMGSTPDDDDEEEEESEEEEDTRIEIPSAMTLMTADNDVDVKKIPTEVLVKIAEIAKQMGSPTVHLSRSGDNLVIGPVKKQGQSPGPMVPGQSKIVS